MKPTKEQIEQATAGSELDAWVAEYVMGQPYQKPGHGPCCTCQVCGEGYDECRCGYSEEIEKAWQVVEKMLVDLGFPRGREKGPKVTRFKLYVGHFDVLSETICATFERVTRKPERYTASGDSVPLAICKAALLAVIDPSPTATTLESG